MLTKNNSFVRSIAMLLAVLMVMALCLTGCGNKAADEALTKAEEAKTLAEDVNAALADYLKTADAETTVKALVDAALADGVATKAEIAELSAKLADYVTLAQVEALITEKVAANAVKDAVTMEQINEILSKYYTKEEVDAKFDDYFGEFTAEQVLTILTSADKAMNKSEWDDATAVVLATIEKLQTLLKSLKKNTYTQANMAKVNECLAPFGITAFEYDTNAKLYVALKLDANVETSAEIDNITKLLEYAILRQATVEDMAKLEAAVEAAVAVPTFETSFAALKADLYGLGDLYVVGNYDGLYNAWEADEYTAKGYYHGVAVKKDDLQKVQIVTLADKAGFHAFAKAYDALLAEYNADPTADGKAKATGAMGWIDGTAYALYETTTLTAGISLLTQGVAADAPANSRLIGYTMLNTTDHKDYLSDVYLNKMEANEVLQYPLITLTNDLSKDDVTTEWKTTKTFKSFYNDLGVEHNEKKNADLWKTVYTLVYSQLTDVQALANTANTTYTTFLSNTVKNNTLALVSKNFDNVTDDEFLAALTAAMCEPIPNSTIVAPFLLDDVAPAVDVFMVANGQAYDETVGGFVRSALYEAMMNKTFDLLWDKYKVEAIEWANVILKDYISVAYEAKANVAAIRVNGKLPNMTGNAAIGVNYQTKTDLVNAMNTVASGLTVGETTTAAELTDGFLDAFLLGDPLTSEMYTKLGLDDKFEDSNLLAFYLNNGEAVTSISKVGEKAMEWGKVYANPLAAIADNAENIRQRLTGSMTRTELAIAQADMATEKAKGGSVRKAFYGLLQSGVEDLDEIYARFLFEDYKKMTYNDMVVKATNIVTFYNKGVENADQTAQVERYLVGVASEILTAAADKQNGIYEKGIKVEWNKDDKGNKTTIKSVTYKANDMEGSLTNGYLLTAIDPIKADLWAPSNGTITEKVATGEDGAMAKVVAIVDEVTTNLENMLIKANFLNYLQEARGNLVTANVTYTNYLKTLDATNWDTLIKLNVENNTADDQITVAEFYFNRDTYKLADYKDAYIENVLSLVADKDNLHLALLAGLSIDEIVELDLAEQELVRDYVFTEMLKEVKSSDATKNWVVGPFVPATGYEYVGTYAVALDQIMNAEYKVSSYKDAAGNIVPLY